MGKGNAWCYVWLSGSHEQARYCARTTRSNVTDCHYLAILEAVLVPAEGCKGRMCSGPSSLIDGHVLSTPYHIIFPLCMSGSVTKFVPL